MLIVFFFDKFDADSFSFAIIDDFFSFFVIFAFNGYACSNEYACSSY